MAGSTPIYGLPYPQPSDLVANYPALGEDLAETLDEKLPTYAATAPASPSVGQVWIDSDDNLGRVWTGTAWQIFSGAGPADFSDAATGTYTSGGINYKYITFTSTTMMTFTRSGLADILVIGGGGGGGSDNGGGGGAGGYMALTDAYFIVGTRAISIGAGGAASTVTEPGRMGTASRIYQYYGLGGGGGGTGDNKGISPLPGGSGGGAGGQDLNSRTGAAGFTGQGNSGGNNTTAANYGAGGGGGAGAAGVNGTTTASGAGGAGLASDLTGTSVTRGGGGGGGRTQSGATAGAGGTGGGGAGGASAAGTAGTANTGGGGGGGGGDNFLGGAGGSGIVVIRVRTN